MDKVIIYDFGSQYTQLIARRIRELGVYSEIRPYYDDSDLFEDVAAVVLSGSPMSVRSQEAFEIDLNVLVGKYPILAICYGAQYLADRMGGQVQASNHREYGRAEIKPSTRCPILIDLDNSTVWMSHADTIIDLPEMFEVCASTTDVRVAAFQSKAEHFDKPVFGVQFHPEVTHTDYGAKLFHHFLFGVAGIQSEWTPESYVQAILRDIKRQVGNQHVLLALSGGVDSSVLASLLHEAIGDQLHCFFVNNGLLRKNEFEQVLISYKGMGLNITGLDRKETFYSALAGVDDPETKRKIIGKLFIEIFEERAASDPRLTFLAQGTIYPDVIESVSVHGPSATIKSHHNVGGLPEHLKLNLLEPLRPFFKDEVRQIGKVLNTPSQILSRHPFPGPGLAIRIIGDVTPDKVRMLQDADDLFIGHLKTSGWYNKVWQAGAMLLPVQSVGVMGDERTYEKTLALRAVTSTDGMTADWAHLPYKLLANIASDVINQVKGINRVVYDISSKPPATIEWE